MEAMEGQGRGHGFGEGCAWELLYEWEHRRMPIKIPIQPQYLSHPDADGYAWNITNGGAGATAAADGRGVCLTAAGVVKASTDAPGSAGATLTPAAQVTLVTVAHATLVGAVAAALVRCHLVTLKSKEWVHQGTVTDHLQVNDERFAQPHRVDADHLIPLTGIFWTLIHLQPTTTKRSLLSLTGEIEMRTKKHASL
ncbi:hypothetical protein E2C01_006396 [Portunus trituberculatus]|uniref:Uncharacterized protein n=1 Tax=Portunus trituberculatus TaxID=210409 RepID=A0A5B7CY35_PORTR|nr:hypothetical protein [Portunus trituberculatus]